MTKMKLTMNDQLCIKQTKAGLVYRGRKAFLSNWFPSKIKIHLFGTMHTFESVEQGYFYIKMKEIGNETMANKVMSLPTARQIKNACKRYKAPSNHHWKRVSFGYMETLMMSKYEQDESARKQLLDTGDVNLIEGCRSHIWGGGHAYSSTAYDNGKPIRGQNRHGKITMNIREILREFPNESTRL